MKKDDVSEHCGYCLREATGEGLYETDANYDSSLMFYTGKLTGLVPKRHSVIKVCDRHKGKVKNYKNFEEEAK